MTAMGMFRTHPENKAAFCARYGADILAQAEELTGPGALSRQIADRVKENIFVQYADAPCPERLHLTLLSQVCLAYAAMSAVPEMPPEPIPAEPIAQAAASPEPTLSAPPADLPADAFDPRLTALWTPEHLSDPPPRLRTTAVSPPPCVIDAPQPSRSMLHTIINTALFLSNLALIIWLSLSAMR